MNKQSYIYQNIEDCHLPKTGFFEPTEMWNPLSDNNYIDNLSNVKLSNNTKIIYFPGSFGCFHEGHLDVVKRAYEDYYKIDEDIAVIISPANAEYNLTKYGNSNFSNNFDRYQRILKFKEELKNYKVIIDLNPMLNHRVDHNFTDFLKEFLEKNINKNFSKIKKIPIIIGGKDRDYSLLNNLNKEVNFRFYNEEIKSSTSKNFNPVENQKRDLFLRVHNKKEFEIFRDYMESYYKSIKPIYIQDEIKKVKEIISDNCNYITICKDYKNVLPYVKLSRVYENPLSLSKHNIKNKAKFKKYKDFTVIDSDIFSGATKEFIEKTGLNFKALIDLSHQDDFELLDIDDIRDVNFNYPNVDVSYRCSLPPFSPDLHDLFNKLKRELIIKKEEK